MTYIYIALFITGIIFAKGLVLAIISKILAGLLLPLNFVSIIVNKSEKRGFWQKLNDYLFNDAFETNMFLHWNYRAFWNLTSSRGGTLFGRKNMTLSAMTGKKYQEGTLVGLMMFFYWFLYAIDYKKWKINGGKGHCVSAYESYLERIKIEKAACH